MRDKAPASAYDELNDLVQAIVRVTRSGDQILVMSNGSFGGAATVYRHNGLAVEASLHEIDGFDGEDPKLPLIRSLGLDRRDAEQLRLDTVRCPRHDARDPTPTAGRGTALVREQQGRSAVVEGRGIARGHRAVGPEGGLQSAQGNE